METLNWKNRKWMEYFNEHRDLWSLIASEWKRLKEEYLYNQVMKLVGSRKIMLSGKEYYEVYMSFNGETHVGDICEDWRELDALKFKLYAQVTK